MQTTTTMYAYSCWGLHPELGCVAELDEPAVIVQPELEPTDAEVEAMVAELCETLAKMEPQP